MKNLMIITIALLTICSSTLFANRPFTLGTTAVRIESSNTTKTFIVKLSNIGTDVMTLELRNSEGEILATEKVKNTPTYEKRFVMRKMPIGEYTLTFNNSVSESVQPITLKKNEIIVDEYARITSYKPTISLKNDKIDVNMMNNLGKKVKIRLFNDAKEVVFFEKIKDTQAITRRYDVSSLVKGNYTVEVEVGEKIYTETIVKN
jgi:hypothetical protein